MSLRISPSRSGVLAQLPDALGASAQQLHQLGAAAASEQSHSEGGPIGGVFDLRHPVRHVGEDGGGAAGTAVGLGQRDPHPLEGADRGRPLLLRLRDPLIELAEHRPQPPARSPRKLEGVLEPLIFLRGLPGAQRVVAQLVGGVGRGLGQLEDRGADRGGDAGDLGCRGREIADVAGNVRRDLAHRAAELVRGLLDLGKLARELLGEVGPLAGVLDLLERLLAGLADLGERPLDLVRPLERDALDDRCACHQSASKCFS